MQHGMIVQIAYAQFSELVRNARQNVQPSEAELLPETAVVPTLVVL